MCKKNDGSKDYLAFYGNLQSIKVGTQVVIDNLRKDNDLASVSSIGKGSVVESPKKKLKTNIDELLYVIANIQRY